MPPPDPSAEEAPDIVVRVLPLDVELTVHPGESVMSAAQRQGYFWPTRCRGQALCTTCLFEVLSDGEVFNPIEPLEQETLESISDFLARRPRPLRLGCQARPRAAAEVFKRGVKPADEPPRSPGLPGIWV
jgi:2Fe-2S ferredoxin